MKRAMLAGALLAWLAAPANALTGFSLVTPTLNLNFGQGSGSVPVVLPVTTKDPYAAYNLATVPVVGSFYASNYVGMNPLRSEPDLGLRRAARDHLVEDLFFLAGGTLLPNWLGHTQPTEMLLGTAAGFGLSFLTRLCFHAPFFGRQAVRFNEEQFKAFQYAPWYAPKAEKTEKAEKREEKPGTAPIAP